MGTLMEKWGMGCTSTAPLITRAGRVSVFTFATKPVTKDALCSRTESACCWAEARCGSASAKRPMTVAIRDTGKRWNHLIY